METRLETAERFSKIWWKSRADGKKSQEYMALSIGVSKKTIQNWERGITSPDLFQSTEWFKTLGLNPISYYLEFLYPEMAKEIKNPQDAQRQNQLLSEFVEAMDSNQKGNLIYILTGDHGGSYRGILELVCAYCHLPLNDRLVIASVIYEAYKMREDTDTLICKDDKRPMIEILRKAIESSKASAIGGMSGYTIQHNDE